jgi:hypothetical protein
MSLVSDYIGERLKAGEDIPAPTMAAAARLLGGGNVLCNQLDRRGQSTFYQWLLKHADEILSKPLTPQLLEAARLAALPFD